MATALVNYYQQKHDALVLQKQTTQQTFTSVIAALAAAQGSQETLAATCAQLVAAIAAKRAQLTNPNLMPADIESLADDLQALLIERRHNNADLLEADTGIAFNAAQVELLAQQMTKANEAVTQAAKELVAAQQRGEQHVAWVSSETVDAITVLQADAQALLDVNDGSGTIDPDTPSAVLAAAKARVEADVPAVLRTLARLRAEAVVADAGLQEELVAGINTLVQTQARAVAIDAGLIAQRRAEYADAETALKAHALGLRDEFSRALGLFAAVVGSSALTTAERNRIDALALAADSDAVTTATALTQAQELVAAKRQDLQLAIASARAADINADPYDDITVQDEQSALDGLESDLSDAIAAHTDAMVLALDEWETAIPDAIWANVHNFDQAIAALERIVDSDGVILASEFAAAELALIAVLTDADEHQRLTEMLCREQATVVARSKASQACLASRQLAALRGDY